MHRWSALNDRQRVLLESLADGEEPHAWAPGEWPSAYALRDRGLLKISRVGGDVHTEVTEAGRFYLHHGHHPDDAAFADGVLQVPSAGAPASTDSGGPRHATKRKRSPTPYSERPVARARRAQAQELVERLVAEARFRFVAPDDDEVARQWRVVNYAKRHGLEPPGKRIEKLSFGARGLEMFLAEGPHLNSRSQRPKADIAAVPVPARLSSPHRAVTAIRNHRGQMVIPSALRRSHF
ncbi:hypothetical protein [Streptomyces albipurpureus]|uniref:Uncharacterized protein n=1 Tax=Streptomyces albipurpureus TaxID=2897419 RepID=A0ABT0UGF0_9ACTN|nr:hypothetical protein [Streptomyces sp. CWNU-1]MCM2387099.1 hypothetical protein [Streptomyces sp. CWNU-1]